MTDRDAGAPIQGWPGGTDQERVRDPAGADVATAPTPPSRESALGRGLSSSGARRGDQLFRGLSLSTGVFVVVVIVAIGAFLAYRAYPSLRDNAFGASGFFTQTFFSTTSTPPKFGIAAVAVGTLISSALALLIAVPIAVGVALFTTEYAPRKLAMVIGGLADLLAAVPSVVYGFWGRDFLVKHSIPFQEWLSRNLGFIPILHTGPNAIYGRSIFLAGVVLAIMILPIVAAISREVFFQVPDADKEAALALGATRLEMIRTAVLPRSRAGVIAASMLGLGRALGETIAVALVLSPVFRLDYHVLQAGGNTIAANIAVQAGEANAAGIGALIASGLVLFVITFLVNLAARAVVYRAGIREGTTV